MSQSTASASNVNYTHTIGRKSYELSNHLGNVLVAVSDGRIPANTSGTVTAYAAVLKAATDYSAFGAPMENRTWSSASYRYGFNGQEKENELHGNVGDTYDFGARIYDARLGRWLSCDPLARKYPGHSSYHALYCSPIIVVDNDGKENVVIVGSECNLKSSNKHYLEAGLNHAIELKTNSTDNSESTTMIVYRGDYTQETLDSYEDRAIAAGVTFIVVDKAEDVPNYVNTKTAPGTTQDTQNPSQVVTDPANPPKPNPSDSSPQGQNNTDTQQKPNNRASDLITDFAYFGHGTSTFLCLMENSGKSIFTSQFEVNAFSKVKCNVLLGGCHNGAEATQVKKNMGLETWFDFFKEKVVVNGTVKGARYYVNWGKNENGQYGIGKYTLNGKREEKGTAKR